MILRVSWGLGAPAFASPREGGAYLARWVLSSVRGGQQRHLCLLSHLPRVPTVVAVLTLRALELEEQFEGLGEVPWKLA